MKVQTKKIKLAIAAGAIVFLGACSSNKIQKTAISPTANPADEVSRLDQSVQDNLKMQVDVLAPEETRQANKYIKAAKEDIADKKDQSRIIEDISYATSYVNKAREVADARRGSIQGLLEARQAALSAGVNNYTNERKKFDKLDTEVTDASGNFTKKLSPDDIARLQREYMALETASISARELGDARAKISGSVEADARKRVPNTLKQAETDLRSAENVLAQNAKNSDAYKASVDQANKSAAFLVAVLAEAKKNGKKTSESVAIQLAQKNQKIGSLQSNLGESQQNVQALGQTVAQQSQAVSLQQAMEKARKEFSKDEAEVSQQGDNLLIRLKTMNFPVGRAELPQQSLEILSKVNGVIASLNTSKVTVEGHTDSTGNATVNQKVSQERAEAVAKYLETSGTDKKEITAVGYGFQKPLASNKSKDGRAQNRRVDVIVTVANSNATPDTKKMAQ
jgi:outer membrane protein OmpA-like peptidoglycan-associated protein